jgi:phospholipid/cholesterol/gamma-HCH transport system permease protein
VNVLGWLRTTGAFGWFVCDFARSAGSRLPPPGRTFEEAYRIGVQSMPVLLAISLFIGSNLALQGYHSFAPLGGQRLVGMFVALAGVRELAPIIAASMISAKAGTEMASQIAVMRTREQIDALEVMAVEPLWWLVTPRLLGIILVMPALTTIAIFVTVAASWAVAVGQLGLNGTEFLEYVRGSVEARDLVVCQLKGALFGVVICLVSCFFGFRSEKGPEGVGQATNAAVVVSSVACVSLNYLISQVVYGG